MVPSAACSNICYNSVLFSSRDRYLSVPAILKLAAVLFMHRQG